MGLSGFHPAVVSQTVIQFITLPHEERPQSAMFSHSPFCAYIVYSCANSLSSVIKESDSSYVDTLLAYRAISDSKSDCS